MGCATVLLLITTMTILSVECIRCAQCNGWHGPYPLKTTTLNTCDNRNNQCKTEQFCVKIVDPMSPRVTYTTFKSDCWFQPTIQVSPTNQSQVANRQCYDYQDASVPTKRWKYCFCNDGDYCNDAFYNQIGLTILLVPLLIFY